MRYKLISMSKQINVEKIATLFYMEYNKDYSFPGEQHNFWELVYCDRGEFQVTAGEKIFVLKKGMAIFHKPNEFHALEADGKTSPNVIVVSFLCTNDIMNEFEKKIISLTDREQELLGKIVLESNRAFEIIQERGLIYLSPREDEPLFGSEQYVQNLLEIFLIELIRRQIFPREEEEAPSSRLTRWNVKTMYEDITAMVMQYFEKHLFETVSAHDLCKQLSMSRSYLEYIFKRQTGRGMMSVFSEMKIEKAKELLRNQNYNITQISEYLGYSSVHYFSRKFKQTVGMCPSEYVTSIKMKIQMID